MTANQAVRLSFQSQLQNVSLKKLFEFFRKKISYIFSKKIIFQLNLKIFLVILSAERKLFKHNHEINI